MSATTSPSNASTPAAAPAFLATPTPEQEALLEKLALINGQDAYSETAQSLGKVSRSDYLKLPTRFQPPVRANADVGRVASLTEVTHLQRAEIYALNKPADLNGEEAVRFGTLRLYAILMGWVRDVQQAEIVFEDPPADAANTYLNDLRAISDNADTAKSVAFLVPFATEYVFRTTGHHFLTGQSGEYVAKYQKLFAACLSPDIPRYLGPDLLYHRALHWISPAVSRTVAVALVAGNAEKIPSAIAMRLDAMPAGTAALGICDAVLTSMRTSGLMEPIAQYGKMDLEKIAIACKHIRANPASFHKAYFAYGLNPLSDADRRMLEEAVVVVKEFAPVAQGFIDAMFADAALGKAQALKKFADEAPVLRRRSIRYFKAVARRDIKSVEELFSGSIDAAEGGV